MSFWDNVKKFTQPYGDDEYDDYDDEYDGYEDEESPRHSRNAEPESSPFTAETGNSSNSNNARSTSSSFSGQVINMNSSKSEVVLFRPATFNDCSNAADDLRNKKAIIVNLENVDKSLARRVVDFLSGCAYALDGKVNKIAQATYLFSPHNMDVTGTLENIQAEAENYV